MRSPKSDRRVTRPSAKFGEESSPKMKKRSSPSRSPARTRRSSAPASPSRKSPSRKQTKVPIRKSPSRSSKKEDKSPSRAVKKEDKSPSRVVKKEDKSPSRTVKKLDKSPKKSIIKDEIERGEGDLKGESTRKSRRTEFSVTDLSVNLQQIETSVADRLNGIQASIKERLGFRDRKPVEIIPRRSSRLQELSSSEKGSSKSSRRDTDEEFSEDDGLFKKSSSRKLITPLPELSFSRLLRGNKEFGGTIGSLILIFLVPATVFYIIATCKGACALKNYPDVNIYKNSGIWFSTTSWLLIVSHFIIQALIALLPIGTLVASDHQNFTSNALIGFVIPYLILTALDFLKILNIKSLLVEYFRLAVASYGIAVSLALGAYWKASRGHGECDNKFGNTGSKVYDFWIGRQINPIIFKRLGLKLWLRRVSVTNALIFCLIIFVQGIHLPKGFEIPQNITDVQKITSTVPSLYRNWTLFTIVVMQIIYFLDLIWCERKIITTFSWNHEGFGYLYAVCSSLYPFFAVVISKNIFEQNVQVSWKVLSASITLYLLGFLLYKFSNNIKYQFREHPTSGKLHQMETMPTFHGQKLLLGGTWGFIRHPNYLGDILIHIALVLPAAYSGPSVPVLVAIITTLILLHRVSRDNWRCAKAYGAAWSRYRARVPSAVIPKIY